eukprot:12890770-Prorocentrum_lima.AAC.1
MHRADLSRASSAAMRRVQCGAHMTCAAWTWRPWAGRRSMRSARPSQRECTRYKKRGFMNTVVRRASGARGIRSS